MTTQTATAEKAQAWPGIRATEVNAVNDSVALDIQWPTWGYRLQHQWQTDDGYVNDGKFSVYAPDYRRSMANRAHILKRAFGGMESAVFNLLKTQEMAGALNPYTGKQTYEPFNGGMYDLCVGVWQPSETDGLAYGSDKAYLPWCNHVLIPMLQHSRGPDKPRQFHKAHGDPVQLTNLHAMIARANFSTRYTSPFNTMRAANIKNQYGMMMGGHGTEATDYNWLAVYDATYRMYRSTLGGGNGFSDVKVTAGDRDAVVKGALVLHSVMD